MATPGETHRNRTVASHFVHAALRGAQQQGEHIEDLLARVGIPSSVLDEPLARVSFDQYRGLIQLLWQHLDDEQLGFGRRPIRYGTFALMSRSVIQCATLGAALRRAQRTYALIQDGKPHLRVEEEGDLICVVFDDSQLDDPEHFAAEMMLVTWHRFSSWLIKQQIHLHEVRFNYAAPQYSREYDLTFSAPLRFEAGQTAVCFNTSYLAASVLQDSASLRVFLQNAAHELLWRREYKDLLSSRIRVMFAHDPQGPSLDLRTVAARLGTSSQTLRRHLSIHEGLGFQDVKDQWRRDVSISLLSETGLPIAEIARRIGFSETSAFHHAFKKWTGLTASAYRIRQACG